LCLSLFPYTTLFGSSVLSVLLCRPCRSAIAFARPSVLLSHAVHAAVRGSQTSSPCGPSCSPASGLGRPLREALALVNRAARPSPSSSSPAPSAEPMVARPPTNQASLRKCTG